MSALPRCAVVVPDRAEGHLLESCLEALRANPAKLCEATVTVASAEDGFAAGCNEGARTAPASDYLVFLAAEAVPLPGWLDALVEEAEVHPEAAAFGPKLLDPGGTVAHAGIAIGRDRWPHRIYSGFPGDHPAVDRARPMVAVSASCLLVRRPVFDQVGGFDARLEDGYEGVDLGLRLGELGHEVRYCPRGALHHLAPESARLDRRGAAAELFAARWRDRVVPDDFEHYLADGLISVAYGEAPPLEISISPLLASVRREGDEGDRIEELLAIRTEQVRELQARRTQELLERRRDAPVPPPAREAPAAARRAPRLLGRGEVRRLGGGDPAHRVSVLMPLKDAADDVRRILPRLFEQDANVELEVIAVDSGSSDDTADALLELGATVFAIDPADFDHGLTRNLAAEHASGDVLVLLNARALPVGERWLAPLLSQLDANPVLAGVCSRVLPAPDADPLTRREVELDPSGSPRRSVKAIGDWDAYRAMTIDDRRLLLNFHTVSAAIRATVLRRIPFRSVRAIGEDLLWAREVLEAGLAFVHEPRSTVHHSHEYSLLERFGRNVDDGVANRDIAGRSLSAAESEASARALIAADWRYLGEVLGDTGEALEDWRIEAALRRAAALAGQWLGGNYADYPAEVVEAFSRISATRRRG